MKDGKGGGGRRKLSRGKCERLTLQAGCGVLADLVSSGMTARSLYRPTENRVVVKEHRVLKAAL